MNSRSIVMVSGAIVLLAIAGSTYVLFANRPTKTGNQFDVDKVSVGDQVAGLAVASIEPAKQFDQGTHYSATNAKIAFSGQITVSGTWSYTPERDSIFGRSYIKVEPDAASVGKLPTTGPIGKAAFEIANLQNAKRILNIVDDNTAQRGQATLLIQDFMLETTQTEGSNQATLVQILSRT